MTGMNLWILFNPFAVGLPTIFRYILAGPDHSFWQKTRPKEVIMLRTVRNNKQRYLREK
jgi:hypothetical protein